MNKEVEEAKEVIKGTMYGNEYLEKITFYTSDIKILLNYIQELEESIHKERELAEAQTTYEVNKMWKEKIQNMIDRKILDIMQETCCEVNTIQQLEKRQNDLIRLKEKLLNEEE